MFFQEQVEKEKERLKNNIINKGKKD